MGGVSKGKINLVELSNVRVNGQSSYWMLTVYIYEPFGLGRLTL